MQALADTPAYSYCSAPMTPAFGGNPAVVKLEREFLFLKPSTFVVFDRVVTSGSGVRRIWTLNLPQKPLVDGDELTMTNGGHELRVTRLAPTGLASQVHSWPDVSNDMRGGYRVDVADGSSSRTEFLHVLGVDGGVASAVRSDSHGKTGAKITLTNGDKVTVRFSNDGRGGTLEIRDAVGAVKLKKITLPKTVRSLPQFAH